MVVTKDPVADGEKAAQAARPGGGDKMTTLVASLGLLGGPADQEGRANQGREVRMGKMGLWVRSSSEGRVKSGT